MNVLEMLDLLRFKEEIIQKLREIRRLEWICLLRPTHPHWDGPEYMPFIAIVRNKSVR